MAILGIGWVAGADGRWRELGRRYATGDVVVGTRGLKRPG